MRGKVTIAAGAAAVRGGRRREVQRVQRRAAGAFGRGGVRASRAARLRRRRVAGGRRVSISGEATIDRDAPRIRALCAATGSRSRGSSAMCARMRTMRRRLIAACRSLGCPRFRIFSAEVRPDGRVFHDPRPDPRRARAPRPPARGHRREGAARDPFRHDRREPGARLRAAARPRPRDHRRDPRSGEPGDRGRHGPAHRCSACSPIGSTSCTSGTSAGSGPPEGRWRWRFDELADGQCDWAEVDRRIAGARGSDGWLSLENLWRVPVRHTELRRRRTSPSHRCRRATSTQRLRDELAFLRRLGRLDDLDLDAAAASAAASALRLGGGSAG